MTTILILSLSIGLVAFATLLLCLRMIITGERSFPSSHIEDSDALKKKGIRCANHQMEELRLKKNLAERLINDQHLH